MDLFGEILEECGVLNEKTYKKKRKKNLKPQKKHKVLKVSNNSNNNTSSNISMSNTQTFVNEINDAIDNMYPVIMNYNSGGKNLAMGERTIYPIAYGLSKANNPVVRAFEPKGDTIRGVPKWKFFRVDRILDWKNIENERFNPKELNGVNETGDMTMSQVFNIAPFGNAMKVDKSKQFVRITPNAISKQDIEQPDLEDNKTYSADSVINDILRNIQIKNQEDEKTVYNEPKVSYNKEKENNGQPINSLEAPETRPISKQEIQGGENNVEDNQPSNGNQDEIDRMTADNQPISKNEIENGNNNGKWIDNMRNRFKDLYGRMSNLYKR